jgi:molybdopterin synthase sulfur carrier subunit
MIQILYFASLKEVLDVSAEQLDLATVAQDDKITDVGSLRDWLCQRGEPWHSALNQRRLMMAVNHTIAQQDTPITDGDEIAFFPPVTGG